MHQPWIDGHLDLACIAVEGRPILGRCEDPSTGCISIPDLLESPFRVMFGTIFTAPGTEGGEITECEYRDTKHAFEVGVRQLEIYQRLEADGQLAIQHDRLELPEADDPLGVYLLMEGADPIQGPENVAWWRSRGLRLVGLTWSRGTRYAGGNSCREGLSIEGRELVAALDEADIAHDASHCSDAAVEDLLACARGRVVATHSNSRSIMGGDNQRHLHDDHAREILQRDGVIGLNLFGAFLAGNRRATIADCVDHVLHFCELAGNRRQVALGSDYDGGFTPKELPEGLEHPRDIGKLLDALAASGFSEEDLAGFAFGNWLRCFGEPSAP